MDLNINSLIPEHVNMCKDFFFNRGLYKTNLNCFFCLIQNGFLLKITNLLLWIWWQTENKQETSPFWDNAPAALGHFC